MSTGYKIAEDEELYFMTFQIVGWVDIFTRQTYRDIMIESFEFSQKNKGLELFAYVIMSNHIHLLARAKNGNLSDLVRDIKSHTSKEFLKILDDPHESRKEWMKMVFEYHGKYKNKQNFQIWTRDNHPEVVYSQKFIGCIFLFDSYIGSF